MIKYTLIVILVKYNTNFNNYTVKIVVDYFCTPRKRSIVAIFIF